MSKDKKDKKQKKEDKKKEKPVKEEKPTKKEKPTKEKKPKGEKKEIRFDLTDGVSWHDFAGIFILFFMFIWKIIRLILAPIFWVYGENVRMFRFVRATGHERTMTEDERIFVESLPLIFTMTGLTGGVFIGILAALSFQEDLSKFFEDLDIGFVDSILNAFGALIGGIWDALVWIIKGTISVFSWIIDILSNAFQVNAFLAFVGLATFGIVVLLIWITLNEKGVFDRVFKALTRLVYWVVGSPDRFRFRVTNYYRKLNHWLTAALIGEKTLITRTHSYFKKATLYTVFASVYTFGAGIYVGTQPEKFGTTNLNITQTIVFTALVLFFAGFVSGTILFGLLARFLDLMNRKKYIAPEFIKEDGDDLSIDEEKMNEVVEKTKVDRKVQEEKAAKAAEKPWKKRKAKKKKKAKAEKTETKEEEPAEEPAEPTEEPTDE